MLNYSVAELRKNINNAVKIAEDFLIPSETILNVKPLNDLKLFFNK